MSKCHDFYIIDMGLVAPRHVGSSPTRDRTHIPYIGKRILIHWATKEVPFLPSSKQRNTFALLLLVSY